MSGILRNTLRLVGTAKYAPNNSTKYLRSMTLTTNRLNNLLGFQANQISTNFGSTIQAARLKILSIFPDGEIKTSSFGYFEVSLTSSKINLRLMTPNRLKNLILPPVFSTKLNGVLVEPESNKNDTERKRSFELDKWIVSLDGKKLRLKIQGSEETFTLEHAVYVEAHKPLPKLSENGSVIVRAWIPKLDPSIEIFSAKLRSKTDSGELHRESPPSWHAIPFEKILHYGHDVPDSSANQSNDGITDRPNSYGQMKLKFPMTVVLEGGQQKIRIKDTDDDFTIYHTVEIQAEKVPAETLTKFGSSIRRERLVKPGILHMELDSGDVVIQSTEYTKQTILMRQEVDIVINLDSVVPTILVCPYVKNVICVHDNE
ncbi:hypothetical protein HCN44_001943 [Aphidius gifuensis]|uniref:Uncharacterized protein n=1 Tax=Aphidius gifuensis TaxID=684658 RepID=A0A834Y0F1_APHGI|nr:hypothetical protein HCN44_001943 [Aphidius gifuensis]